MSVAGNHVIREFTSFSGDVGENAVRSSFWESVSCSDGDSGGRHG